MRPVVTTAALRAWTLGAAVLLGMSAQAADPPAAANAPATATASPAPSAAAGTNSANAANATHAASAASAPTAAPPSSGAAAVDSASKPAAPAPSAAQVAATAADADDRQICRRVDVLGSRVRKEKICRTRAEWDQVQQRAQETMRGIDRSASGAGWNQGVGTTGSGGP
jgi:hypothetical protein